MAKSKFSQQITNNNGAFNSRVDRLDLSANIALKAEVDALNSALIENRAALAELLDFSPNSKDSLTPNAKDFNAANWAAQIAELTVAQKEIEMAYEAVKAVYEDLFSVVEDTTNSVEQA